MNKALTMAEIKKRHDGEWILVDDPVTDASNEVISGRVLAHSKDRDEVYALAVKLRPKRSAILCLAKLPEDAAIIL